MERKLGAKGVGQDEVAGALDGLAADGLQNDQRFADAYVRQRADAGFGPRRITQELRQRGVDSALIAQAIGSQALEWDALAAQAQLKKFRGLPRDAADRARQSRFLEYRGFASTQIRHALRQAADDEDI